MWIRGVSGTANVTRLGKIGWSLRGAGDRYCSGQIGRSLDTALRFIVPAKASGSRISVQGRLVGLKFSHNLWDFFSYELTERAVC